MEVKNIIKGKSSTIKVGTNERDKTIGKEREEFKFLKNSISSKRFKTTPNAININIAFVKLLKKPSIKYLFIIVFIMIYVPHLWFQIE